MPAFETFNTEQDWDVIVTFLPEDWREKARELGSLQRCRKFCDADSLLRTLLIHLADGCSLRETAVRARLGELASVSDVALLKRLKNSGEWLRWMAAEVMRQWIPKQPAEIFGEQLNLRIVDGSTIQEPGSTGSTWRIHYSIRLPSLQCDEVHITSPKIGESFKRFVIHPGDLFLGDRGFAHRAGVKHVIDGGGDVIVRTNLTNLALINEDGTEFPLLSRLRSLKTTKLGDWNVCLSHEGTIIRGRICALKKSRAEAEKARLKAIKDNNRKGHTVKPETIEAAGYTFVFTTLNRRFGPASILEMYRGRWQIELSFKRLKSIMQLGHLKKTDIYAAKAWIHGKLLVAFLVEALVLAGESFFPWGYPIRQKLSETSVPVERNFIDASPF